MARRKKKPENQDLYTPEQAELIEKHIEKYFGRAENFFQKNEQTGIQVNINIIPPSRKQPFYTLVTSGVGAHVMRAEGKSGEEFTGRAEFVLCLPPGWKPESDEAKDFWPVRLLDIISEFAAEEDIWLGWGHTIEYGENFRELTGFQGVILIMAMFGADSWTCKLNDKEEVSFYQVIPLFESEIRFKEKNGSAALINQMGIDFSKVADPDRKHYVPDNFDDIIDTVEEHACKVEEKALEILDINGANHISAFLRWMIDHSMINDEFLDYFAEEFEQISSGELDIRKFLINSLDGELNKELFTDEGQAFSGNYYDFYRDDGDPCYPSDVDRMALDYFGEERYNSDEFQDEAYLFVPFDESYFDRMFRYIDKAYENFQKNKNTVPSN